VNKFLRTVVNFAQETPLEHSKKGLYLRLLEVFIKTSDQLVRPNQCEVVENLTADVARSNVLFLLQD